MASILHEIPGLPGDHSDGECAGRRRYILTAETHDELEEGKRKLFKLNIAVCETHRHFGRHGGGDPWFSVMFHGPVDVVIDNRLDEMKPKNGLDRWEWT